MRFSIKGMLIGVGAVALGCAALLNANAVWGGLAYLSALLSISVALVAVIHLRGARRAFWTGFAICGWVYLLHIAAHPTSNWARSMPTTEFLDYVQVMVSTEETRPLTPGERMIIPGGRGMRRFVTPSQNDFRRVGHSVCLLLFAFAGGLIGRHFYATKEIPRAARDL